MTPGAKYQRALPERRPVTAWTSAIVKPMLAPSPVRPWRRSQTNDAVVTAVAPAMPATSPSVFQPT